jgi:hypothetical protein
MHDATSRILIKEKKGGKKHDSSINDDVDAKKGRFHLTTKGRSSMMLRVLLLTIEIHKLFKTMRRNRLFLRVK